MNNSDPLFHKPKTIIAARNILYATIFLGIVNSLISRWMAGPDLYFDVKALIINAVSILLIFFLTMQIGLGKKWARTTFLILFILGLAFYPFTLVAIFKANILIGFLAVFVTILEIVALVFLYSKDSTRWFNYVGNYTADHPIP